MESQIIEKTFVFDIDGTICTNTDGLYEEAVPHQKRINYINELYDKGYKIVMFTARGSTTNKEWYEFTKKQLNNWGLKFHELILKKPYGNLYIDDKGIRDSDFFNEKVYSKNSIDYLLETHRNTINKLLQDNELKINLNLLINSIFETINNKGKLIVCGNGGSMSDALHFSAEFTGRFKSERDSLPSIVLGSNQSSLSAIANDYSYEDVFSRELSSLGNPNDILVLFSTSGNSKNIINCAKQAFKQNIKLFCLTSLKVNKDSYSNNCKFIEVKSKDTAIIQEIHNICIHIICEKIDQLITKK